METFLLVAILSPFAIFMWVATIIFIYITYKLLTEK